MNNSILRKEAQEQLTQSYLFTVLFMLGFISITDKPLFKKLIFLEQLFLITKSQSIFLGLKSHFVK